MVNHGMSFKQDLINRAAKVRLGNTNAYPSLYPESYQEIKKKCLEAADKGRTFILVKSLPLEAKEYWNSQGLQYRYIRANLYTLRWA